MGEVTPSAAPENKIENVLMEIVFVDTGDLVAYIDTAIL